jgi:hypothetical protein
VRAVREAGAPQAEVQRLSAIMLPGTAKAGRTWELAQEDQVYFVKVRCVGGHTPHARNHSTVGLCGLQQI